eukprot:g2227.t1
MVQTKNEDAHLDSVTDYVEDKALDSSKTSKAMEAFQKVNAKDLEKSRQREKELAAVKVSKEDIELVVSEFGLTGEKAERILRECGGDVEKALVALVRK